MRAVIQRVRSASVHVERHPTGTIGPGLLVLLGVEDADALEDIDWLGAKLLNLRLFADESGAMTQSLQQSGGELLVVSQFTLFASTRKGTKPSWHRAAKPEMAEPLYQQAVQRWSDLLGRPVQTGRFGAMMEVTLVNDRPVTLIIDSKVRE